MWRILSGGKKLKQNDVDQGKKTGKTHTTTNQGSSQVAEESSSTVLFPLHTDAGQQPLTDRQRYQVVQGQSEEPSTTQHPPPQTNGERQFGSGTGHLEIARESIQVSEESPAAVSVEDLETDDIVIAVMGPTGSGKSTFIRVASGRDTQGVGHTLKSFTSQVLAVRFLDEESGRYVVLVDTPGFDDTFKSDLDILSMISNWLKSSYEKQKLLSGILYLHRITDNRMAGTPLKNLRVFRKLCGRDALEKVYLTTTMWDEVEQSVGERRLDELKQEYWKAMIMQGARVARCRNDDDSPKKLLQQILDQDATRKAVLLQEEMADLKKELKETEAGQELFSQLEKLVEKQMALLQRIHKERKAASDPTMLVELQTEYNDLRMQIDDKLRQMQVLKLSRLKNLLRIFGRRRE